MSCYKDLLIENQELRELLIEFDQHIREIKAVAAKEDVCEDLQELLASTPKTYLSSPAYTP